MAVPCPFVALNRFTVSIQKEMLVLMGKEARSSIKVFMLVCVYGAGAGEDTPHAQLPNLCCKIIVAS